MSEQPDVFSPHVNPDNASIAETFFTKPAPDGQLPQDGVNPRAALRVLQSEMILDGDPNKNLATFVTTFMEPEAHQVIAENLHRNYIDHAEYPRTAEVSKRCVRMIHSLFGGQPGEESPGTATAGSSEAVMLGALAMKWQWKKRRKEAGKPDDKPNLVYGADVHVVWDKFCRYFDVEPRQVNIPKGKTTVGPDELGPLIDENTIGVIAVVGTTFTGECDDVEGIDRMLQELKGKGLEVPMHIDAASGGFVFPFTHPEFKWDFRLDSVVSINASGHKFGLVFPGIGWLLFRNEAQLPEDLVFYEDYLGEKDATFTLNFSGSASFVLAQYYNFVRLGFNGYSSVMRAMTKNRDSLVEQLEKEDALEIWESERPTLPLVICRVKDNETFDASHLVGELSRRRGWLIPAYDMPPDNEDQKIIRMLVKLNQTRELVDVLCNDFHDSIELLRSADLSHVGEPPVHSGTGY
ncbi:MAG: glutamate decarboxylase [Solirubrobacterales bacterium]|nr:glutamate decarboxylase [Solirubrobacterales bacterium]HMT05148.1 glutamate decarboxylase [Solirubrobacterales bacterium]